ncbi:MAG: peptidase M16 [Isosphaeraceae bacterium]|jgi:zinc protease|nr:MAG: peptidase M16 [Isosphaeraceae bacterium]
MPALLAFALLLPTIPEVRRLPIESYRLPNGLRVVLQPDPSVPRVAVAVAYHVGSRDERVGRTGFAHFFEHMMFRGTAHVPNFDLPLQEAGGSANAFTTEDLTVYHEVVTPEYLERALYLEADRLANLPSALDQEKFDTEREVVKNERRQSVDNVPYGRAEETLAAWLFPAGHPYSWSVIGSLEDLDRATLDDLRSFFATHYHPGNAAVCLSGSFDLEQAKRWIAQYFGAIPAGVAKPAAKAAVPPRVERRVEISDRVTLPRVYWAWPTVADEHPDAAALELLAGVLAGSDASRLEQSLVRQQQVAASVAAVSETREIAGLFQIVATPVEGVGTEALEAALAAELEGLRTRPPTPDELRRVQASVEKATYERLANPLLRATILAIGAVQYDRPERYRDRLERALRVTPADLERVASAYLTPEKVVLVVRPGDHKSESPKAGPDPDAPMPPESAPRVLGEGAPDWSRMPGPAPERDFTPPPVVRDRLSSGLEIWFVRWPTLPLVEARLFIPAGSAHEPPDQAGLAELTARLARLGTKTRSASELAQAVEALGGSFDTDATLDEAVVSISALAPNFEPILALVAEALTHPRLDPDDVSRERTLQVLGLKRAADDPAQVAARLLPGLIYGRSHPYGRPPGGRIETVERLTVDQVAAFHRAWYRPRDAVLVVAGDLEPDRLRATLERTLGAWTSGSQASTPIDPRPAADAGRAGVVYLVDRPGAAQTVIRLGRSSFGRDDPRHFAAELGNRAFGGDFLSRLNQNLRERNGYTYGAGSRLSYFRQGGSWTISTSVRTDVTGPALQEIVAELRGVAADGDRPLAEAEIAANRQAEAQSWLDGFGSPASLVGLVSDFARHRLSPEDLAEYLRRLRSEPDDAIRAALAELAQPDQLRVLLVGDRAQIEPQVRAAGMERVEVLTTEGTPAP